MMPEIDQLIQDGVKKAYCSHPLSDRFTESDNNGGTVAFCLCCEQDVTYLLPEPVRNES